MNSNELRESFIDFFRQKDHEIVLSAPMVIKNDPTLMFTNAGMNQFKDLFLGNTPITSLRKANSQKCLRVSGKHNDLEEVGHDTYHHTMFEMLGNWSFGDPARPSGGYFKKEAIKWAWEFLVDVLKLDKTRIYATVFEGDKQDNTSMDKEAFDIWSEFLDPAHIITGTKKDNFWEMGETGPCGSCSEIHFDIRDDNKREKISGSELVNKDNPEVIEIWNLVFMQFNRKANGELENLSAHHIDTGMGFERLCMVSQNKKSNYDTDVFQKIIQEIAEKTNLQYGKLEETDVAMRVIADHLRAVSFSIADGQLPSNNKAGYVIRRILRRAVRYAYTFLDQKSPIIYKLVNVLVELMGEAYPEIKIHQELIEKVIKEEEISFLNTLSKGIILLDDLIKKSKKINVSEINGKSAFELFDTYGFPLDLTELILREKGFTVNKKEFDIEMAAQKLRSKMDAVVNKDDWVLIAEDKTSEFIGYDELNSEIFIIKYRQVETKGKTLFHLIFNKTPFYAESGGQVGDKGYLQSGEEKIFVIDTIKENNLNIHVVEKLPSDVNGNFLAVVSSQKRINISNNHSATHLLHYALRQILGTHVEQRGSFVNSDYFRFDFSHFQKVSEEEINKIESIVNQMIRKNIILEEQRFVPIAEAQKMGAMALFGEKYGDRVRVIKFDNSVELCGGTHVNSTGQIGFFKITSESSISAGVRRIEGVTGEKSYELISSKLNFVQQLLSRFNNSKNLLLSIDSLISENAELKKKLKNVAKDNVKNIKDALKKNIKDINGINFIAEKIDVDSQDSVKDLIFQMKGEIDNLFMIVGVVINNKPTISIIISDSLVKGKKLNAGQIVSELAKDIQGGGGGQAFFATAGGKNPQGLDKVFAKAKEYISKV